MPKNYSRLTLEEISAEINVSRTTIYKVINNKGVVSEKTREKVLTALEKYNYVPNNNARNLAMNKKYRIALIDFESPDATYFSSSVERGIQQVMRDYGDHGLTIQHYTSPVHHPAQQNKDIHESYDRGIRHFIIASADCTMIQSELDWLAENDCTVILLSKDIPDSPCDAFIGIDEYKGGKLAGEVMGKMMPVGGKLQILMAKESSSNIMTIKTRYQGFLDKIRTFSNIEVLPVASDLSGKEQIQETLLKILETPGLSGIFDLTYQLELVSQVLRARHREDLKLVGIDLFPEIRSYIADNTIDAVVFQNLEAQTYLACRLLFENICYGKTIKKEKYYSKLDIIMSENLEYF